MHTVLELWITHIILYLLKSKVRYHNVEPCDMTIISNNGIT